MKSVLAYFGAILVVALIIFGFNIVGVWAVTKGLGIAFKMQYVFIPIGIQIMALGLPKLDINRG